MQLPRIRAIGSAVIWFALAALFATSALIVRANDWYTPGSDLGYYLGLTGGILMILLLVYPLKKRVKWLQRFGATKPWFVFHMACGVIGPLAVLYHSTFRINSQNALVAMVSMLLVAGSGVIGRYIYVRIHDGVSDHELKLDELENSESTEALNFSRDMVWAPDVVADLIQFRAHAQNRRGFDLFAALPIEAWRVRRKCHRELRSHLARRAEERGWSAKKRTVRARQFDALVAHYTATVLHRAQYGAYKRLFALWHVLHLPFVYLLAASAIYHVVAVHMY
jgi:hypothetical protein